MDTSNHDKVFVRTFMLVLSVLFGIMFTIMFIAGLLTHSDEVDPAVLARIESRLQPVGTVVTDPAALVKVSASKPKAEPRSAEKVVASVCSGCHAAGVLNAPKLDDKADWSKRKSAAGGVDGLVKHAIVGIRTMPPKGGDASLSDDEVRGAVELILKKAGA